MVIGSGGKIVVVGNAGGGFAVARYRTNGRLDRTFSGDGMVTTDFGDDDSAMAVAMQADGKVVVAGYTGSDWDEGEVAGVLARYRTNGTHDKGLVTTARS